MWRVIIFLVVFIASCGAPQVPNPYSVPIIDDVSQAILSTPIQKEYDEDRWPQMTAELVTAHSPKEIHALWPFLDLSEAGYDDFYEEYGNTLSPETDRQFPVATKIRLNVLTAFDSVREMQQLMSGGGSGYGHEAARLIGKVEHLLFSGFHDDFAFGTGTNCTLQQVETALAEMRNQFDAREFGDAEQRVSEIILAERRCVEALRAIEVELGESGGSYFRYELLVYVQGWL